MMEKSERLRVLGLNKPFSTPKPSVYPNLMLFQLHCRRTSNVFVTNTLERSCDMVYNPNPGPNKFSWNILCYILSWSSERSVMPQLSHSTVILSKSYQTAFKNIVFLGFKVNNWLLCVSVTSSLVYLGNIRITLSQLSFTLESSLQVTFHHDWCSFFKNVWRRTSSMLASCEVLTQGLRYITVLFDIVRHAVAREVVWSFEKKVVCIFFLVCFPSNR